MARALTFSVVIPAHNPDYRCFEELAVTLTWALVELRHEVVRASAPVPGTRAIVFGVPEEPVPPDTIFYNGEQVNDQSLWAHRRLPDLYRGHVVWDYSAVNAARYPKCGLPVPHVVRPGHCPDLEQEPASESDKTHDFVFVGSSNPRREDLNDQLQAAGLSMLRVPYGTYGVERDAILRRGRFCINAHYYEHGIFESVRCSHMVHLGVPVISEGSEGLDALMYNMQGPSYALLVSHAKRMRSSGWLPMLGKFQREAMREHVSTLSDVARALDLEG